MICPIMSITVHSKFHDKETVFVECKLNYCQWWLEGNCIVFDINNSLKAMATAVAPTRPETVQPRPEEPEPAEQAAEEPSNG